MDAPGEDDIQIIQVNGLPFRKPKAHPRVVNVNIKPKISSGSRTSTTTAKAPSSDNDEVDCTVTLDNGNYVTKVNMPRVYYKFLIGKKGATKQKIQKETGATIVIPGPESAAEEIIIRGPNETAVLNARTRLDIVRDAAHKSLPYSHFLSLPLTGTEFKTKLGAVRAEMIKQYCEGPARVDGLDASLFGSADTMHVTLLMLKLFSTDEIERAKALMKKISARVYDVLETRSLVLQVGDLAVMNDDPARADVLYLKVKDTNSTDRLAKLSTCLAESFAAEGLHTEPLKELKLHVTLCNSRYRKQTDESEDQTRVPFDARPLLAQHGTVNLGTHRVEALHLSERGKYDANRYYHCVDKINLP